MTSENLCLTCSSSPLPRRLQEKEEGFDHITPCCRRRICYQCIKARPRLRQYCIVCQTSADSLTISQNPQAPPTSKQAEDAFVLGDSDDDDCDDYDDANNNAKKEENDDNENVHDSLPPAYEELDAPPPFVENGNESKNKQEHGYGLKRSNNTLFSFNDEKEQDGNFSSSKGQEQSSVPSGNGEIHYIRSQDTLVGIAFEYGVDPRLLARINQISEAAVRLQPALLHTRSFLILPSSAKSKSNSPKPLLSQEDERIRLLIRRFQVAAKCPNNDVAKIYIQRVLDQRKTEADFVKQNMIARRQRAVQVSSAATADSNDDNGNGDNDNNSDNSKNNLNNSELNQDDIQIEIRKGGELEDALDIWREDLEWEKSVEQAKLNKNSNGTNIKDKGKGKEKHNTNQKSFLGLF